MDRQDEALGVLGAVWDKTLDDSSIVAEHNGILNALAMEREHGEYKWTQLHKSDPVHTTRRILLAFAINSDAQWQKHAIYHTVLLL